VFLLVRLALINLCAAFGPLQPVIFACLSVNKVALRKNCSISALTRAGRSVAFSNSPMRSCQIWKRRHELQQSGVDMFSRRLPPFFVVAAPRSRHILRPLRRDKPRKNCSFWKSLCNRSGAGKHGFHPRCRPNPVRSEDALHVNAKVHDVWRKPKVLVRVHHHD
jgi:hypothetical protein